MVALVILSPLGLILLDGNVREDWHRLSNVAQTYGAVSAVIAAIALVGVASSLIIQNSDAKTTRSSALRTLHVDLMQMAMEDPVYMECWGMYCTDSFNEERQFAYVNLIINQWITMYELGECSDALLLVMCAELFSGAPGRRFWHETAPNRQDNRFYRIVDKAYYKALEQPPAIPPDSAAEESAPP